MGCNDLHSVCVVPVSFVDLNWLFLQDHSNFEVYFFRQIVTDTTTHSGLGVYELTEDTLSCLTKNDWLNDEVINAYMSLLSIRNKVHSQRNAGGGSTSNKCAFFSTFWYKILRGESEDPADPRNGYSYDRVKRWSRGKVSAETTTLDVLSASVCVFRQVCGHLPFGVILT